DSFAGIIITSNTVSSSDGAWEYYHSYVADPETGAVAWKWDAIPTGLTEATGFVIGAECSIRFQPAPDYNGVPPQLEGYIFENEGEDAYQTGTTVDASERHRGENYTAQDPVGSKDTTETRISDELSIIKAKVTPENDRPYFDPEAQVITKATIEDRATASFKIKAEAEGLFSDDKDDQTTPAHGGSSPDAFWGIAVSSVPDASQGKWQYSATGNPDDWTDIVLTEGKAKAISGDMLLRFVPAEDFFTVDSDAVAMKWHLVEVPDEGEHTTGEDIVIADDTTVSLESSSFKVTVDPRNDAPEGNAAAMLGDITEDVKTEDNKGGTVNALFNLTAETAKESDKPFGDPDDKIDETHDDHDAFAGIVITANKALASEGVWQYSADGSSWTDIGGVSETAGLVIGKDCSIRFV
ncbi:MAG: hypothetical protein HUK26_07645, partial [Duodenibacillus sp.]|nr:hypothetical protein [Duodenibacillus sp.]